MATNTPRTFDWRSHHDERSRSFPVSALHAPVSLPNRTLHRGPAKRIDQGREGACVGFAMAISMMSAPVAVSFKEPTTFAQHVYREAQKIDYWPGEDYEGTSVLAGAQILQRLGYIDSYWWAFGIDQVLQALVHDPVIIGVNWYSDMYWTSHGGFVSVGGAWVGGHAICLTGFRTRRGPDGTTRMYIRWRNSWGLDYGNRGDGWISAEDLDVLLRQQGEACVLKGQRWVPLVD